MYIVLSARRDRGVNQLQSSDSSTSSSSPRLVNKSLKRLRNQQSANRGTFHRNSRFVSQCKACPYRNYCSRYGNEYAYVCFDSGYSAIDGDAHPNFRHLPRICQRRAPPSAATVTFATRTPVVAVTNCGCHHC